MIDEKKLFFQVQTPLGFLVRTTEAYWNKIISMKHPVMKGKEKEVIKTLMDPEEVRQSRKDPKVFLFYCKEREKRWICAVVKRLNGEGFLITTYPTDTIKEGERIWPN